MKSTHGGYCETRKKALRELEYFIQNEPAEFQYQLKKTLA